MLTIGIPVRDALKYLEITMDSVIKNTITTFEIILVDDNSNAETKERLKYFSQIKFVKLITNPMVRGFPANCNTIIKNASYDKICLLNSDVYAPYGWDVKLVEALNTYSIVGPSTSHIHGVQQQKEAFDNKDKWDANQIEAYAIKIANLYRNEIQEIETVGGFCYCITKQLINEIGMFDTRFGLGSFEESDLSMRARLKGHKNVWVKGSYIHHFGHKTFCNIPKSYETIWKRNEEIFNKKWGIK